MTDGARDDEHAEVVAAAVRRSKEETQSVGAIVQRRSDQHLVVSKCHFDAAAFRRAVERSLLDVVGVSWKSRTKNTAFSCEAGTNIRSLGVAVTDGQRLNWLRDGWKSWVNPLDSRPSR